MATRVIMPKQGLQMTEGTITRWIVKEGQMVEAEAPLFEMETDKLTIEIAAPASGTLLRIIWEEGEVVPITEVIAVIGNPGEDISGLLEEKDRSSNERIFATPRAKTVAAEMGIEVVGICGTGPEGLVIERDVVARKQPGQTPLKETSPKATPLAVKLSQQKDIKLDQVDGSGPGGKITRYDVEAAAAKKAGGVVPEAGRDRIIPFAGMRKVISDRMLQSLHEMAQANHRMKVDMTETVRFRERLKADDIGVSYTDILVKAVSRALLDYPILNSSLTDEGILIRDYVNMGVAVAVENGLIVPVIKDAHLLALQEISSVSARLADRAKKGGLKPEEYTGGTFTITNLGMFGIDEFTAIINPPESTILAVGKIDRIPVAEGDQIVIRPMMMLSLTYDHRVIDGAPAAQFLQRVRQILQNPYLLI